MSWYKFSVSDNTDVIGSAEKVMNLFSDMFTFNRGPKQFALFNNRDIDTNVLTYYLHIPTGFDFLRESFSRVYPLTPCEKPLSSGLRFISGHADDKALAKA